VAPGVASEVGERAVALAGALLLGVALVGAVLAVVWATSRGELVDVTELDGAVVVRPRRGAALWSLKRELRVPRSSIVDVRVVDGTQVPIGFRMPGTGAPGILLAGSFGFGADRAFWIVRGRPGPKLVLDLRDHAYARVVLEVSDPAAVAARLLRAPAA
jgi:hypothetical protein